jgi:hypothetical protein
MQESIRSAVSGTLGFDDGHYHSSSTGNYVPLADLIPSELEVDWRETNDLDNKIVALIADADQSDEYEVSRLGLISHERKRAFSDDMMEDVQPEGFFSALNDPPTATFNLIAPSDVPRHMQLADISHSNGKLDTTVITNLPPTSLIAGKSIASKGKSVKKARSGTPKAPRSSKHDAIPWEDW